MPATAACAQRQSVRHAYPHAHHLGAVLVGVALALLAVAAGAREAADARAVADLPAARARANLRHDAHDLVPAQRAGFVTP